MRGRLVWVLVLTCLALACAPLAGVRPTPSPTPESLKPANLRTPRPALPLATPTAVVVAEEQPTPAVQKAASEAENTRTSEAENSRTFATARGPILPVPTPTEAALSGTPVAASEPLVGFLLDDRLESAIIGQSFAYRIYLPPDYLTSPDRRYPVLYMLHGAGGNYTEWSDSFLPEQIDRLIVADQIQPLIVVMPDDGESTYYANWDNGPRWGDYVTDDVVSTIDQRYRTLASPDERAIGGLSMGGLGALNLAFQHPDVFGIVGSHSPSVRLEPDPNLWFLTGDNFWQHDPIWLAEHSTGLENLKIWLDAGSDDWWLPNIEAVHTTLVSQGLHVEWHEFSGEHEAEYWIDHVPDYLRFYSAALEGTHESRTTSHEL
jgi:enterochelin esterase-like enzyme